MFVLYALPVQVVMLLANSMRVNRTGPHSFFLTFRLTDDVDILPFTPFTP